MLITFPLDKQFKMPIKVILCDIEGTTTSIDFVKKKLFPFSYDHFESFLKGNLEVEQVQAVVNDILDTDYVKTRYGWCPFNVSHTTTVFQALINDDAKLKPFKELQGMVWEKGYKEGTLKAHIYPDVAPAFKRWTDAGFILAIYSSGSVQAQKLLFAHTIDGNLLPLITYHFDTTVGHKQEPQSYKNIVQHLKVDAAEVLFLTDIVNEAEAARAVGVQSIILSRPGNTALTDDEKFEYTVVQSFEEIKI